MRWYILLRLLLGIVRIHYTLHGIHAFPIYEIKCKEKPFQLILGKRITNMEPTHTFSFTQYLKEEQEDGWDIVVKRHNENQKIYNQLVKNHGPKWENTCLDHCNLSFDHSPTLKFERGMTEDTEVVVTVVTIRFKDVKGKGGLVFAC